MKKKFFAVFFALLVLCTAVVPVFADEADDWDFSEEYPTAEPTGVTINVYNWGEYISDGSDDSVDVIKEFEEISGINKAGKYMLSVERAAFVPIDVLSDLDYFAVRNSHVALEHFPIADMKRCIFQNHSFFPPLSSQKQLSFLRLYYCYY